MLSWIQKYALLVLLRQDAATVRQMRPADVEANLFAYHLDGLLSDGYVQKISRGTYALTAKGERLVGAFSTATNAANEYIKTVIVLYAKTTDDRYLMFRWSRQPYLSKVGLLHDHLPLGRSLKDGLVEATTDKLNVSVTPDYMTSVLVKIEHDGELVTHMNALVYRVELTGIVLPYRSRNGTAFLGTLDGKDDMMDGLPELLSSLAPRTGPRDATLRY